MNVKSTTTVIIGGGHSGLAMSASLSRLGIDHAILERGEVANTWKTERWDSLRLLTPNWQCRLPGYAYDGDDPDGFMTMPSLISFMDSYASMSSAPIETHTEVLRVSQADNDFEVQTRHTIWRCKTVVLANGNFSVPRLPAMSSHLPKSVNTLHARYYHNPSQLADGPVLVVGASASGLQLANEIHNSGRTVTLAAGEHVRLPRKWRGKDILWWMDTLGRSDEDFQSIDDIQRARKVPSPQLVGTVDGSSLDLNSLTDMDVRLTGRLMLLRDNKLQFSGSLPNHCKLADLKMNRFLNAIDEWIAEHACSEEFPSESRPTCTRVASVPLTEIDLREFSTILWATGYQPDYRFLDVPVLDGRGRLRHEGGVVCVPGLYAMGLPFMRKRKSTFIHGAEDDARDLSLHISDYLAGPRQRMAS